MTETTVRETGKGLFKEEITMGRHVITADEPEEGGGDDTGPSPYDLLLASLGACTTMTLRLYANHKNFPLKRVTVKLSHEKVHAKDCENCENDTALVDHIDRKIELEGNLTSEQRLKLLDIANKCPVHRTLTSKINITTELVE